MEYYDIFEKNLSAVDKDVANIINFEEERQAKKIILIASESICPKPVREALGSVFTNLYAEGYPHPRMSTIERKVLVDLNEELAFFRRYADKRYYKGCDYVDFVEALAQKRCAQIFATDKVPPEQIFVNVQPLSGAAANNAVYEAFLKPGDPVMGMSLSYGGHLTHGNPVNRSGKYYKIFFYEADPATGKLSYERIKKIASEIRPKMIIAGYSAYPWSVDWAEFREIADSVGAYLMSDIAHPAGLVVAGKFPNPIGYADVVTFTTHKTICGPRGAVIMTTDEEKAKKINTAVFPGEQGGPHICNIAAKAVAFKIAQTEEFKKLQEKIVENAQWLASSLKKLRLKLAYGGTDSHMLLIDLKSIKTPTGFLLTGEIASRILDLCGITCNKNTIGGDTNPIHPSAIRLGTTWVTQRGMGKPEMEKLAELIHRVLTNIHAFEYKGAKISIGRGKIDLEIMEEIKKEVTKLESRAKREMADIEERGYPHYSIPEVETEKKPSESAPDELETAKTKAALFDLSDTGLLEIRGERAHIFLNEVITTDLNLEGGQLQHSFLLDREGKVMDDVFIHRIKSDGYLVVSNNTEKVKGWLRGLSDGYITFDRDDVYAKIEGPVVVEDLKETANHRKVIIGLYGLKSIHILKKIIPEISNLEIRHFAEFEIEGNRIIVSRIDEGQFQFYPHPDDVPKLWNLLLQKGEEFGIKPCGLKVLNLLRRERGLPSYEEGEDYTVKSNYVKLSKCYFIGQKSLLKKQPSSDTKAVFQYRPEEHATRKGPLYEEHKKLTNKLIPFAGWEMPVWYTSVSEEHMAVRETAGLFDVSHMGVLEIKSKGATRFLDVVTTNYVRRFKVNQAHYSYILDQDGSVLDDVFIYRRAEDKYLMVVNAVNAEKIFSWLNAVNSKKYIIDRENPAKEIEGEPIVRDLRSPECGKDRKVDLALQGPNSLLILQSLTDDEELKLKLARIKRTEFIETKIAEMDLMISHTGYTGEDISFELYVHPDDAPKLWNLLLEKGREFGIKPTGLGARDSTRTEAGFPLWGHELAGKYDIVPSEAGYGHFVKLHKPFFIGKKPFMEKRTKRQLSIARFRMNARGVKTIKIDDPVANRRGEYIGRVTSCALIGGVQLGLVHINKSYTKEGTSIRIFSLPKDEKLLQEKPKDKLSAGDRLILSEEATILPRFMAK